MAGSTDQPTNETSVLINYESCNSKNPFSLRWNRQVPSANRPTRLATVLVNGKRMSISSELIYS